MPCIMPSITPSISTSLLAMTGIGFVAAALALPAAAYAQGNGVLPVPYPMSPVEVQTLPPEYRTGPIQEAFTESVIEANGEETIMRTRRIESSIPYPAPQVGSQVVGSSYASDYAGAYPGSYPQTYAPAGAIFERDQWLDECRRRTDGRDDREKGGIIGGLLGAIAGGILGNRIADGERLAGTLIGAGTGGIAGLLLGNLIGGGRDDRGDYDCEAALDSYLSQYGYGGRIAARTLPPPVAQGYGYPAYPQQGYYDYGYAPAQSYQAYSYQPPQQVVYVPIRYEQQQRVIVRETVREELIPGAARIIPAPQPAAPRYIKGN
jgi:hypothetical protein